MLLTKLSVFKDERRISMYNFSVNKFAEPCFAYENNLPVKKKYKQKNSKQITEEIAAFK